MNIVTKYELGKMDRAESMAYIAALTTEVDRLQRRSRAHRQNIRSMSAKLELANAKDDRNILAGQVTELARIARVSLTADDVRSIVAYPYSNAPATTACERTTARVAG